MNTSSPFSLRVPKTCRANLKWRAKVMRSVLASKGNLEFFRDACAKDPLFFIGAFCWTYDPRVSHPKLPFILYPFQEDAVLEIIRAIGDHDLLIEKSRDMGASWLNIAAFVWCFLYVPGFSGLFVSRVEEYVDKPGNPKALFWKFDYILENLPIWLRPDGYSVDAHRSKMHVENPENGAVIDGESTTGNVARGDRRTAILLDEFAAVEQGNRVLSSTRDATNCRLFNSTPDGSGNAFYKIRQTGIKKLRLHWSLHPIKAVGLYTTSDGGKLRVLDPDGYPLDYHPILDGKMRSPWYDAECRRAGSDREIAQELDIDYLGSGGQYFKASAIATAIREQARPSELTGELEYDDATGEPIRFVECAGGHLRLWITIGGSGKPLLLHKYAAGCDVSAGTGASNSCCNGFDQLTCEKTWEYTNPYLRPEQFAKQVYAIGKWFGGAYVAWESDGPGRQFGSKLIELGYSNIYMRKQEEAISGKVSDIPGWHSTREGKLMLLGTYRDAIESGACINRSQEALEDALEYVHSKDGGVEHSRENDKTDSSGARTNHGDRVIADALAWKLIKERAHLPVVKGAEVPVGSLAWRNQMREKASRDKSKDGW